MKNQTYPFNAELVKLGWPCITAAGEEAFVHFDPKDERWPFYGKMSGHACTWTKGGRFMQEKKHSDHDLFLSGDLSNPDVLSAIGKAKAAGLAMDFIVAPGHNPDRVLVTDVGEGYRLLDPDEIKNGPPLKEIEAWGGSDWFNGLDHSGNAPMHTYRTKLSRQELESLRNPKPAWKMPEPPAGEQWHRDDFTEEDLQGGYRPLLLGEIEQPQDEVILYKDWLKNPSSDEGGARPCDFKRRTRRPLPTESECRKTSATQDVLNIDVVAEWKRDSARLSWLIANAHNLRAIIDREMNKQKPMTQQLGPNQTKWLAALRSGQYKQGKGLLHSLPDDSYCCLGVACEVAGLPKQYLEDRVAYDGIEGVAPESLMQFLALHNRTGDWDRISYKELNGWHELTAANDYGVTFAKIADFIEANPHLIFTEPR